MDRRPTRAEAARRRRALFVTAGLAGLASYCWWASGLRPFSAPAYLAVGLPVGLALAALAAGGRRRRAVEGVRPGWPWAVPVLLAAGLEGAALALGGKDRAFPSLSTVLDQLLRWQGLRAVLFALWLLLGALLVWPARREGEREKR